MWVWLKVFPSSPLCFCSVLKSVVLCNRCFFFLLFFFLYSYFPIIFAILAVFFYTLIDLSLSFYIVIPRCSFLLSLPVEAVRLCCLFFAFLIYRLSPISPLYSFYVRVVFLLFLAFLPFLLFLSHFSFFFLIIIFASLAFTSLLLCSPFFFSAFTQPFLITRLGKRKRQNTKLVLESEYAAFNYKTKRSHCELQH